MRLLMDCKGDDSSMSEARVTGERSQTMVELGLGRESQEVRHKRYDARGTMAYRADRVDLVKELVRTVDGVLVEAIGSLRRARGYHQGHADS